MSRQFPARPVVGVGAVVIGTEGVLLVRRGNPPLAGEWSLPGGAVETGETVAEALAREVAEETGLRVRVGPLLDVFDRIYYTPEHQVEYHYVLIDFLCAPESGSLTCGSDAADVRWVAVDALETYGLSDAARTVIAKGLGLTTIGDSPASRQSTPARPPER